MKNTLLNAITKFFNNFHRNLFRNNFSTVTTDIFSDVTVWEKMRFLRQLDLVNIIRPFIYTLLPLSTAELTERREKRKLRNRERVTCVHLVVDVQNDKCRHTYTASVPYSFPHAHSIVARKAMIA